MHRHISVDDSTETKFIMSRSNPQKVEYWMLWFNIQLQCLTIVV